MIEERPMSTDQAAVANAVAETVKDLRRFELADYVAELDAAAHGSTDNLEKSARARAERMRYLADKQAFVQYRDWDQANVGAGDPLLARQLRKLHHIYAQGQRDPDTINEIARLNMKLNDAYTNFRGKLNGKPITNKAIE